jgi:HK97 family phage major capsid protein
VNGDTGKKQTTSLAWTNKYIDAEELAVIVPIPQAVLDDTSYDIWGQVRPEVERAMAIAVTEAVLYGTNIPASWTTNLGAAGIQALCATSAPHSVSLAAFNDYYDALLAQNGGGTLSVWAALEADGFLPTGSIAHLAIKAGLRGTRSVDGVPIFKSAQGGLQSLSQYEVEGTPIFFPTDGSMLPMAAGQGGMFTGQWDQLVFAMRQDITYKILDQAVIQDGAGTIVYNLAQQDMVALRAVMRLGFALPNPINRVNQTAATRIPFAMLTA